MIYVIGAFIAFFLALIIFTKKRRNPADTILGIWMIIIGLHLFAYYSYVSSLIYQYPQILWVNLPYPFLHGPMLYFYTQALTSPLKFQSGKWIVHLILPVLIIFINLPFVFLSPHEQLEIIKNVENSNQGWQSDVSLVLLSISGIIYVYITNLLLLKHKKRILNQFSNQEKINLNWLRVLFYGMGLMWILIIFTGYDPLIFTAATVFIVFIGYYGIKQVGIFTNQNPEIAENEPVKELVLAFDSRVLVKKKYAKSGLSEDWAKEIHRQLKNLMDAEKLFTETELNLSDLASRLDIHPNYLSQVINEYEGVNFHDYINTLRIKEFKRLVSIPENQKYTLLSLAYDCGFNSKSAFNRYFKKVTDLSPSEYMKKLS
jgi:AraC-like DNA-binding protein